MAAAFSLSPTALRVGLRRWRPGATIKSARSSKNVLLRPRIAQWRALGGSAVPGWNAKESPYDVLGVERDCNEEGIKSAYRRLAKLYHPDVYSGDTQLLEDETVEGRFIKIQAAYELLTNQEARRSYDYDNRSDPMKASKAWMEWFIKKKQAYEQRGDLAVTLWAQQQQREMNLKARQLARHKMDPEEEKRIIAKEKQASTINFETTLKRHTLVLKKRDIERRRSEEEAAKNKLVQQLLASEGLELDDGKED
ncbi:hypothetical protein SELMODRAFT_91615 [Selaginella moellendorffii]|uniref:J domain-containing protein n=1 Tax=Selaginella moellendorffii TaxID=88036 RepID=D8RDT8_SELML|nr:hypothetical protein SELMODRAFT_91615 [Selaginella moellendorffii]